MDIAKKKNKMPSTHFKIMSVKINFKSIEGKQERSVKLNYHCQNESLNQKLIGIFGS